MQWSRSRGIKKELGIESDEKETLERMSGLTSLWRAVALEELPKELRKFQELESAAGEEMRRGII